MLVLIRGLPGSGKTTLALAYKSSGFEHCEADEYFMKNGKYEFNPRENHVAHAMCLWHAFSAMVRDGDVVVANTFTTISEMLPYIRFAQMRNVPWTVYTAFGNFGSTHGVPQEKINQMKERWESSELLLKEKGWEEWVLPGALR